MLSFDSILAVDATLLGVEPELLLLPPQAAASATALAPKNSRRLMRDDPIPGMRLLQVGGRREHTPTTAIGL
jgi:hypothetical protein